MALRERKAWKRRSRRTRNTKCSYTLATICTSKVRDKLGVVGDVAPIGGSVVAPPTRTAILRRLEKIQGRGRARHDSHRRGTGERRSHGCTPRARTDVWL